MYSNSFKYSTAQPQSYLIWMAPDRTASFSYFLNLHFCLVFNFLYSSSHPHLKSHGCKPSSHSLIFHLPSFPQIPTSSSFRIQLINQFAAKIAASQQNQQNPPTSQTMSGSYGGAPPTGYIGGPPPALQSGGYVSQY